MFEPPRDSHPQREKLVSGDRPQHSQNPKRLNHDPPDTAWWCRASPERNTKMRETIRNGKLEIIGYRETGSGNREILRDKNSRIVGRFETDTGSTRDASGK